MKQLIVDYGLLYNRIALLNRSQLTEIYIENQLDKSLVGNIYLGRIVNIVKSMSAAFIDIGEKKNAYMPLIPGLKSGEEILVQIRRDAVGDKGATVTTDLSLSGHYMVLLPKGNHHMISKKITDKERKSDLLNLLKSNLKEYGSVVRTEALKASDDDILNEIEVLKGKWMDISKQTNRILSNRLVYEDYTFEALIKKEYLSQVDEVVINNKEVSKRLKHDRVVYHDDDYPIFETYKVETQLNSTLDREIKLHQGSFITIDETEALTAIDVNSGQYVGSSNKEQTFFQVNLAAAKEIAKQIRLRNISGIIVIDFINMKDESHYSDLMTILKKHFRSDKCHPQIHGITALGLIEVTRKKNRKSLKTQLVKPCEVCHGSGVVLSDDIIVRKLMTKLELLKKHTDKVSYDIKVSKALADILLKKIDKEVTYLEHMMSLLGVTIYVESSESLSGHEFQTSGL